MSIALLIVGGIVIISLAGILSDTINTAVKARAKAQEAAGAVPPAELAALKDRIEALESRLADRDEEVRKLQDEVRFVGRMLEDKTGGASRN